MTKSHAIFAAPLLLALLGLAFCIWSALGNDVNFCVTTGCTLYQDSGIGGISLWWFGACAFACLALCALLGQAAVGRWLGALFLLGDVCLLLLMSVTAPCISCLVAALFFAICYFLFRRQHLAVLQRPGQPPVFRRSALILVWTVLYIVNLGQVVRSQFDVWPMLNESGQPSVRIFFSPTCPHCIQAVEALSGNVNVAWYPLADHPGDTARISRMMTLIEEGLSMDEAVSQSYDAEFSSLWQAIRPDIMLLRFRMLCNKAHVFMQGSQGVPFLEYKGLPPGLAARAEEKRKAASVMNEEPPTPVNEPDTPASAPGLSADPSLPGELIHGGQCGPGVPCPPAEQSRWP